MTDVQHGKKSERENNDGKTDICMLESYEREKWELNMYGTF